ncbi:hypothetical protein PENTCL1PPCAC_7545 [Pristionchus entomophagus]|uniref:EGF-like domain-containing protein n=1 Tax=Pristionchus entomophagus TaxID=358040 RepID=A0AAV5SQR4_9BILA|nr:hypothetical protein PENTCL1PPCAC_7545 [Pristionchus entomophagus]
MWSASLLLALIASALTHPVKWSTCEDLANCNNHGVCSETPEGFFCFCQSEWVGTRCQMPINKVLNGTIDEPCENMIDCNDHGVCSGNVENLECNCYPGWYGVRCQIPEEKGMKQE